MKKFYLFNTKQTGFFIVIMFLFISLFGFSTAIFANSSFASVGDAETYCKNVVINKSLSIIEYPTYSNLLIVKYTDFSGFAEIGKTYTDTCPTSPDTAVKTPSVDSVCAGTTLSLSGPATGGIDSACTIEYRYSTDSALTWINTNTSIPSFSAVSGIGVCISNLIQTRRANCTTTACPDSTDWITVASWIVCPIPDAPIGDSIQHFCISTSPIIDSLNAIGSNILWYDSPINGNIISGSTALVHDTSYWATQTIYNCESQDRLKVTVKIDSLPVATAGGIDTICVNASATVSGATAENGTILWTEDGAGSLTNETTLTPTYNPVSADAGQTVTLTMIVTSNNTCSPQTDTAYYTVKIDSLPVATAGGIDTICVSASATVSGATAENGTILWTEDGAGSLTNETTLTPTYNPVSADAGQTVTLTMIVTSDNTCSPQTDTAYYTVKIDSLPVATAGGIDTICVNASATVNGATAENGTILWTEDGAGSLTNETTLTPTYNPVSADAGQTVTLTMIITSDNTCSPQTDTAYYTVKIDSLPVATAGGIDTICVSASATVSGATAENGTILWTEDGAGSLTNETTLTPTYNPVSADAGQTVTLTMIVTSNNTCSPQTDTAYYTVKIDSLPVATAGGIDTICVSASATVSGATAENGTILWTEDGAGSLTNETTLTPTYNPVSADAGQTVTLTMIVTSNNTCSPQTDTAYYTVKIDSLPVATAGGIDTICVSASATVSGATAENGTILWTEDGAGSLTNETTLTPTYNPVSADAGQTVTLTMIVTSNNTCSPQTDTAYYTVKIDSLPVATAGGIDTICVSASATVSGATAENGTILWTEDGAGSLTNETTLTPTYNPVSADAGQTVTLTMIVTSDNTCRPQTDTAYYTVKIDSLPVATAGGIDTICVSASATVSGATAENGTILWTEDGAGSLTNETTLTPTYNPVSADAGQTVTLTMIVTSNNTCSPQTDTAYYTVKIDSLPVATAGGIDTICVNASATVNGATAENGTILWTEDGAGSLTNETTLTPTYNPVSADAGQTVTLTMIVTSDNTCSPQTDTAYYTVKIDSLPVATAGGIDTICVSASATVSGATAENGTILWTEDGAGSLTNETTLTPTYNPVSADAGQTVTLTMIVTSNNTCSPQTDTAYYTVKIDSLPVATAGGIDTICVSASATVSGATAENGTILWTEDGAGSLTNETTLTPTYNPVSADAGQTVTLTMIVTSDNTCSPQTDTAYYTVKIDSLPVATAGGIDTICVSASATVSGATAENGTILWTEDGAGSLTNETTLTPTYNPVSADAGQTVTLTMIVTSNNTCSPQTDTAYYTVKIDSLPVATAGGIDTICVNASATVSGATAENGTILWTEDGAGSLTNETTLIPTYNPVSADAGQTVTLTMIVTSNNTCSPQTDTAYYTVKIDSLPVATAGGIDTICVSASATVSGATAENGTILWTEDGAGSLTNETTLTPTYNPVSADAGQTVTLTMIVTSNNTCSPQTDTAYYTVKIDSLPVATAGGIDTICVNGSATVSGATAENGTILWTEDGAGSLTNETTLTPTYNPVSADAGQTVTLTMIVTSNNTCSPQTDTAYYTVKIDSLPVATAGGRDTICANSSATVSGATAENGTILWKTNGAGNLTDSTTLTPTYISVTEDGGNSVTLMMIVTSANKCSPQKDTAYYYIFVNQMPEVTFGVDGDEAPYPMGTYTYTYCYDFPVQVITLYNDSAGKPPYSITYNINSDPSVTKNNLSADSIIISKIFTPGTYVITITDIVDSNGCHASAEFLEECVATLQINTDIDPPVIDTCPVYREYTTTCDTLDITSPAFSSTQLLSSYAEFSGAPNNGVATDNCAIKRVYYQDAISGFYKKTITRTWTLVDSAGNSSHCNQTILLNPPCAGLTVTDIDSNTYDMVLVGTSCWTKQNMKNIHYATGTVIPIAKPYYAPDYPDSTANVSIFGRLYSWYSTVNVPEGSIVVPTLTSYGHVQGICPDGWYIPENEQYQEIQAYGSDALKSSTSWLNGLNGSNSTGFSGLPGGYYDASANACYLLYGTTSYWSALYTTSVSAPCCCLEFNCPDLLFRDYIKANGNSVRCVKECE